MVNRTRVAAGGAVALAIFGAILAMQGVMQTSARAGSSGQANMGATNSATTAGSTATKVPTATPTATPQQPTEQTIQGTIASIGSNSFQLRQDGGATVTVVVNGQTAYHGAANTFSDLQSKWQANQTRLRADVLGTYQTDGTFLAANVDSSIGDD